MWALLDSKYSYQHHYGSALPPIYNISNVIYILWNPDFMSSRVKCKDGLKTPNPHGGMKNKIHTLVNFDQILI